MLNINLSGASLAEPGFLEFMLDLIKELDVPAERLCFEVTETAAIANLDDAISFITSLKAIGCSFALDDFGSGLSSFAYLKHLPVDYLKIDGGFVKDMLDDPIDRAMVEAINRIGHVMGIKTVAEFVENGEILEALRETGVDYVQGYHIDKPHSLMGWSEPGQYTLPAVVA
jgi:Amt family ammonium transporter